MSDRVRRDRIVGGVLVAVGAVGLIGSLAFGWTGMPGIADGPRVGSPPWTEPDRGDGDGDVMPDWMDRLHDWMQQGPLDGRGPGRRGPGMRGQGGMDGWLMPPGMGGPEWHRGPWFNDPNASPSPNPSASPSLEASPSPSPATG